MMRRNRTTAVICLALIMMFTFASVVSAAVPQGLYIQGPQGASFVSLTYWAQNMNSIINLINGATGGLNGVNYVDGNQNYISLAQVAAGTPITNTQPIPSGQESQVLGSATFTDLSTNTSITPDVGEVVAVVVTATNPSATGFTLNFDKAVTGLVAGDIVVKKGADTVTCEMVVAADGKSVAVSGTFAAGEYTVTITKTGYNFGTSVNVVVPDGNLPSFTMEVNAGLSPGKSMVIVTLNTDTPQNYNVAVDGVSLNYNSNTKKFWGEVNTASAVNSKVNVSPKN